MKKISNVNLSILIFTITLILNYSCSNNSVESENSNVQNNDSIQPNQNNIDLDTVKITEEPKTNDTVILPNPILVNSDFTIFYTEYVTYIEFSINKEYFYGEEQNELLSNANKIKLAIDYFMEDGTEISDNAKKILSIKDSDKQLFIKYKNAIIIEGGAMTEGHPEHDIVLEDYEIIGESPVIVKFTDFQMGDYSYYQFTTNLGYTYSFNEILNNKHNYEFEYMGEDAPYGKPCEKSLNEKFKIYFHYEMMENDYVGGEFKYFFIDSINFQH